MSVLPMGRLPCAPRADRILVKPYPVVEDDGLIKIPESSQQFRNGGWLLAGGLMARDQMRDHGDQLGDELLWGKFAGVWEEWDHIIKSGSMSDEECGHLDDKWEHWGPRSVPFPKAYQYTCEKCGAIRLREPLWVMNVEDILANISLQARIENGEFGVVFETANGQNQHVLKRSQP